jgi:hypothetical protein
VSLIDNRENVETTLPCFLIQHSTMWLARYPQWVELLGALAGAFPGDSAGAANLAASEHHQLRFTNYYIPATQDDTGHRSNGSMQSHIDD